MRYDRTLPCSFAAFFCGCFLLAVSIASAGPRNAMILNAELEPEFVRIVAMNDEQVEVDLGGGHSRPLPIDRCLAIIFADTARAAESANDRGLLAAEIEPDSSTGRLDLVDGQRYVGRPVADVEPFDDVVTWEHPVLGLMEFKLDDVHMLTLPDAPRLPSRGLPRTEPELADVVVLRNGDELHGFIVSIHDSVTIELVGGDGIGEGQIVELPLNRVASVTLIAAQRDPTGPRLWLTDGTIMAVQSFSMPETGNIDVIGRWHGSETQTLSLPRDIVAAKLVEARRIVPLSSIAPMRVEAPPTRYQVSDPVSLDDSPLLGISRIEYRGPLTVHYRLPARAVRFAADALLPRESRTWGDFELLIRIDGHVVERRELNEANPTATINIEVEGSELTVELLEGESGPVHNHLILSRAALLLQQ